MTRRYCVESNILTMNQSALKSIAILWCVSKLFNTVEVFHRCDQNQFSRAYHLEENRKCCTRDCNVKERKMKKISKEKKNNTTSERWRKHDSLPSNKVKLKETLKCIETNEDFHFHSQ